MIDPGTLTPQLRKQVVELEDDLRIRAAEPEFDGELRREWEAANDADRHAVSYAQWLEGQLTQSAVAWVLGTVFLRFCEDNDLIPHPFLAGRGDRIEIAVDRQRDFFTEQPTATDRDWVLAGFDDMSQASPVAAGLFDERHNPMWRITPSHDAAKALVEFWRQRNDEGTVVHDFHDEDWNTRFLGDLYQDLSEAARDKYALLQTPEFVEEFILDLTLTPALEEFGLDPEYRGPRENMPRGLRLIDPTCGSGHFLLGAFHRLLKAWELAAPGVERWELVRRVLYSVHGVDKNPFAVAVARFRLLLAATQAADTKTLRQAPNFDLNIAVGDSLLHGRDIYEQQDLLSADEQHTFVTEDIDDYKQSVDILGANSYHVVVGNPPYVTVKDANESKKYRYIYGTCHRQYSLAVPFAERFFRLGTRGTDDRAGAGYIGQITANSFMKREFGKKLIEEFFNGKVQLTHVIDSSGAYIPGHGTPTVILVGRNSIQRSHVSIRTVLGVRGEPKQPLRPAEGLVWQAIVNQVGQPGSESDWVGVTDLSRDQLACYPWSLSGGGAGDLLKRLESSSKRLAEAVEVIGRTTHTGLDEAFYLSHGAVKTRQLDSACVPVVLGENIRDFQIVTTMCTLFPYDGNGVARELNSVERKAYWSNRSSLRCRKDFGKVPEDRGLRWFDHSMFFPERFGAPMVLPFSFVATHNNFVLDRGGKVFKQSAPVIKLPDGATEDDHLQLLGLLNSSTACFWLKQVSYPKGGDPIGDDGARVSAESWSDRFEFTGTKLQEFPLPATLPLEFGRLLDAFAQELAALEPSTICQKNPTRSGLDGAKADHAKTRARMIAMQEELDWQVYGFYGLLDEAAVTKLTANLESVPGLNIGERAFEIVLARKLAAGETETQWFTRHGSTPITEIPSHWPDDYKVLVQRRIDIIEKRRDISLIERPECKRRWQSESWEKKEAAALRDWLLDACERRDMWFEPDDSGVEQPQPLSIHRLADKLSADPDVVAVARIYAGTDATLSSVISDILETESVPYLAALRYKEAGMRKRREWEQVWEQQREEDRDDKRLDINVPPKYTSADFRKSHYWKHRGKLDVPKERFIAYPNAEATDDPSPVLGWAGWDHREAAHALIRLIEDRSTQHGYDAEQLKPLLAGLAEQLPWVSQWHNEIDPAYGINPADAYTAYLEDQRNRHHITEAELAAWRPAAKSTRRNTRGSQQ